MSAPTTRSSRISELDALRGIAAVAVMIFHYTAGLIQNSITNVYVPPFEFAWGEKGVHLFFMISGYVIFMTLDRTSSALSFAWGRFSRLFPAYWVCVLITYAAIQLWGLSHQDVSLKDMLFNLTMMPRFVRAKFLDGSYWSLEFEVLFYIAMLGLHRMGLFKRFTVPVMLAWLAASTASFYVLTYGDPESSLFRLTGKIKALTSLDYIHLFAVGMTVYDSQRSKRFSIGHGLVLAVCAVHIFLKQEDAAEPYVVCAAGALLYFATMGKLPFLSTRPLLFLGAISYPLYLVHQTMGLMVLHHLDQKYHSPFLAFLVACVGSVLLGWLIHSTIEMPVMRALRNLAKPWFGSPKSGSIPATTIISQ
jgi:peptidoglycan/LPS O-acetylase OafA/YrhL